MNHFTLYVTLTNIRVVSAVPHLREFPSTTEIVSAAMSAASITGVSAVFVITPVSLSGKIIAASRGRDYNIVRIQE